MNTPGYRDCPGCGLHLPMSDAPADERFNASPECWQIYGELTGYTIAAAQAAHDTAFIHQHLVDAYAVQHVGEQVRPMTVAFGLIGLYLACEKGCSGKQVQHMHLLLSRRAKTWPVFTRPAHMEALTVQDVLQAQPGEDRDAMLRRWSQSVWDAWGQEHERVKALIARVMDD